MQTTPMDSTRAASVPDSSTATNPGNRAAESTAQSAGRVTWPGLTFPAINLYSMPRQAIFDSNR